MKSKQFLVLGLGRFGASLAKTLCDLGQEVLAVDADEELVNNIAPYVTQAMQLDATDETLLATLGVKNFDAAIVSIGQNTRDSILVCVLLKELGAPYLVAKANDDLHAKAVSVSFRIRRPIPCLRWMIISGTLTSIRGSVAIDAL